jgi:NADH-quinone oxidoreductase chain G
MVTLTIDNKQVSVGEGTTILKAAEKLGIEIPTFCYHDKLETVGACRMCLVEVEKTPKLQIACATIVSEGMVVKTDTLQVVRARKGVLEFLLINHPLDCPVCDKGGECELQNLVFKYGSDKSRFGEEKRRYIVYPKSRYDDLSIGTHIIRNMNRCILCRKCVRFINEIAGEADLGTFKRGSKTEINVLPDIPLGNPYSGNVVEICPVGALTSKSFRYKIRVWQTKATPSICPNCTDGCNIKIWAKDERIYRITSRRNDQVDEGFLCDKGRFGFEFVNHPDRLRQPLIKKNGRLTESTWEEAIGFVASNLKKIKGEAGPYALAGVGSPRLTNEENFLFQKLFRSVIGTNNLDHRVTSKNLIPSPDLDAKNKVFGMTNSISQIEETKLIIVLGCDLEKEHPIINLRLIKATRKGSALLVANPNNTRLSRFAQDELIYNKGTEAELLKGMIREIIEAKLYDLTKAGLGTNEIEDLRKKVSSFEINKVSLNIGIRADKIKSLAKDMTEGDSTIILCGEEIIKNPQNTEIISLLFDLLRLTGQHKSKNSGINLLWENCNSQGALDCGVLPDRLPGYTNVPGKPGLNFNQMLEAVPQGKIKVMYIAGVNPLMEYPDSSFVRNSIGKVGFLVVQDIFLTETAKLANVVFPGASFAEKEGTFTNVERRVQRLKKAFDPLNDAKADWQIFCMLAKSLGNEFDYSSPKQIFEELVRVSPLYGKLNWDRLGETGMRWELE